MGFLDVEKWEMGWGSSHGPNLSGMIISVQCGSGNSIPLQTKFVPKSVAVISISSLYLVHVGVKVGNTPWSNIRSIKNT